jgi:hypothetical protein
VVEQKKVRWSSQKMQGGRAKVTKKCKVIEQKLQKSARWSSKKIQGGRAKAKKKKDKTRRRRGRTERKEGAVQQPPTGELPGEAPTPTP